MYVHMVCLCMYIWTLNDQLDCPRRTFFTTNWTRDVLVKLTKISLINIVLSSLLSCPIRSD